MSNSDHSEMEVLEAQPATVERLRLTLRQFPSRMQVWLALFDYHFRITGDVSPALALALELLPRVPFPEDVFLPLAKSLHGNGLHDVAVSLFEAILANQPDARVAHSEWLVHRYFYDLGEYDAKHEHERWNERFIAPVARGVQPAATSREPNRPLRIGFVSNDFVGHHSLNAVIAPWFMCKDKRSDTYLLYSNGHHNAPPHKVFVEAADYFVDVHSFSDDELSNRIREDRVDILVDMISHGERSRLLTYARKPAPIIVSWIGVGIATGVETVDYLLADKIMVPEFSIQNYREKVVYLQSPAMVWCPPNAAPCIGHAQPDKKDCTVFGNLTRIVKFRPETVAIWAKVLQRVPYSLFLLKDRGLRGKSVTRLESMFAEFGITPDRLICREGSSQKEHLSTYNEVDIVLDCYPQNGGISSLEALWMGCPVVSLCHLSKPSGRVGRYILENVGLPVLATSTEESFVNVAERLARQPELLAVLRRNLRESLIRSPLCDFQLFQRNISAAFRQMWIRYCDNEKPESFAVSVRDV